MEGIMSTAYRIWAVIRVPTGDPELPYIEHEGRWLIRALSMEDACRELIHRLAVQDCWILYYVSIQPRSTKPS